MNGWLILDKPSGITSAQAVAKVKKLLSSSPSPFQGEGGVGVTAGSELTANPHLNPPPKRGRKIKIGHAGTLDPLASGVLPLALGEATKTTPYMMDKKKAYAFTVAWGEKRDTDDSEGKVIAISDKRPTQEEIEAILPQFTGRILQTPPIFSAIKVAGERAYDLARAGERVELEAREVRVESLILSETKDLTSCNAKDPSTRLRLAQDVNSFICHCSKGTYIRSLARDLGDKLGCYGYITVLRRLSVGRFGENDAISLDNLEKIGHKDAPLKVLPVESALDDIPALEIEPDQAARLKRGQSVPVKLVSEEIVLARCGESIVALCSVSQGQMKPVRVFNV